MLETVVLVHGLFLQGEAMLPMAVQLRHAGFATRLFSYPTLKQSPRDNAYALKRLVAEIEAPTVHFVGHSLGGLVLRHYFALAENPPQGRVVTLGTPHRYSQAARVLARFEFSRQILNKSLDHGLLGDVPPWDGRRELGSIAGTLAVGLGRVVGGLNGPNDGTVTVEETKIAGMSDHICLPLSHMALMFAPAAASQTNHFLRHGRFRPLQP
ncbi:MAG: alpha/beta fold hydrolase [Gammaproteobacteria bacterium]